MVTISPMREGGKPENRTAAAGCAIGSITTLGLGCIPGAIWRDHNFVIIQSTSVESPF